MWIVGDLSALDWDGETFDVTLPQSLPVDCFLNQKLSREKIGFVENGITNTSMPLAPLISSLASAIRENQPHSCDVEDNWASFATAMAAVESDQTGLPVKVPTE